MKSNKKLLLLVAIPILWLLVTGIADQMVRQETNKRFAKLSRGVNIFYTVDEVDGALVNINAPLNQITEEDVARIKNAGLTHIRLAVSPYPLMHEDRFDAKRWQGKNAHNYLQHIHEMIQLFLEHDIAVVLAVMPSEQTFERLYRTPDYADEWVQFFHAWGKEFATLPKSMFFFETLNEPRFCLFIARDSGIPTDANTQFPDAVLMQANTQWIAIENRLVEALHSEAPNHSIIVTADGLADAKALALRKPSPYPYTIHAFHYYTPLLFTHQQADWAAFPGAHIAGLNYPTDPKNCRAMMASANASDRAFIEHYCRVSWNAETHLKTLESLRDWSKRNGLPVWMSEFGAYPLKATDASVNHYYEDVKTVAETYGFGWCAWEYVDWLDRFSQYNLNSPAETTEQ